MGSTDEGHVPTTYRWWCIPCHTPHVGLDLSLYLWWWCQTIGDRIMVNIHHICDIWATWCQTIGDRGIVNVHHIYMIAIWYMSYSIRQKTYISFFKKSSYFKLELINKGQYSGRCTNTVPLLAPATVSTYPGAVGLIAESSTLSKV